MNKKINLVIFAFIFIFVGIVSVDAKPLPNSDVKVGSYVIGTHLFERSEPNDKGYKGYITTDLIMLGANTIKTTDNTIEETLSKMVIYYKKNATTWVNALTLETVSVDEILDISHINLEEYKVKPEIEVHMETEVPTNTQVEFSVETIAKDFAGVNVVGTGTFSDMAAIEKIEYYEVKNSTWYELTSDFGPADGFPLADATSNFRVTFKKAGTYTYTVEIKDAKTLAVLSTVAKEITVKEAPKTTVSESTFIKGMATEFDVATIANDYEDIDVIGTSTFSDDSAISKIEYYEVKNSIWYDLKGNFGGANGFPLKDDSSKFRVTFDKVGTYTLTIKIVDANTKQVLSTHIETIIVKEGPKTTINTTEFVKGVTKEFTIGTIANDYEDLLVIGSSAFSDDTAIEKLEYLETKDNKWYELNGDFGPEEGFPLADAISKFRVDFNKVGKYTLNVKILDAKTKKVLSTHTEIITVKEGPVTTVSKNTFEKDVEAEFDVATIAKDYAGVNVIGTSEFSDNTVIGKIEYLETKDNKWHDLKGSFGGTNGFPLKDASSKFRVTFNKEGTYTLTVKMITADTKEVLSEHVETITVE